MTASGDRLPLLSVRGLSKSFPGQLALSGVDLDVHAGEVVAVVGQNGSGKSTMVKSLTGVHEPDPGSEIHVRTGDGEPLSGAAARSEIHVIHQDLGLISMLNTVENLDLDHRLGGHGWLPNKTRRERDRARSMIRRFGTDFDVELPVQELSPAERTIVAIARALDGWTRPEQVLLLDEPTASLHHTEVARLFTAVRRLAESSAGIIFISHRLDEVLDIADRVVCLRGGRVTADVPVDELDHARLITLITGKQVPRPVARRATVAAEPVLVARGLTAPGVYGVDLEVRAGEIVGVAGLLGSGREHVASLIFGGKRRAAGEVEVAGVPLRPGSPSESVAHGLGFVPADRAADGAVLTMSARENLTLPRLGSVQGRLGSLNRRSEDRDAFAWARRVELDPPQPEREMQLFSGGNQQKVMLAKWLRNEPRLLLLDEPTQGVDVGAKAGIYELILDAAATGTAILVSSSDGAELAQLCDRIVVMRDGVIAAELGRDEVNEARLVSESLGLVERAPTPPVTASETTVERRENHHA